ncbi:MAG: hypothetical protein U1D55_03190 [Phycisphaerae bacterium]
MSTVSSFLGLSSASGVLPGLSGATSASSSTLFGAASLFGPDAEVSVASSTSITAVLPDFSSVLTAKFDAGAQTAPPIDPRTVQEHTELLRDAALDIAAGKSDVARAKLEDYLKDHRPGGEVLAALASIEQGDGNYEKAERLYRQADQLAPDKGYGLDAANAGVLRRDDARVLADARRQLGDSATRDSGVRLLRALTARSPQFVAARLTLADALVSEDRGEALVEYGGALQNAKPEQLESIEQRLQKLLKKRPNDAFATLLVGRSQLRRGEDEAALATLETAFSLGNGGLAYGADLAAALVRAGSKDAAEGDFQSALTTLHRAKTLDPTSKDVRLALTDAYVSRAEQRARRNALADSISDFRVALTELGDADPALSKKIAALLFATGSVSERQNIAAGKSVGAEAGAFQTAFDIDPENTMYRARLAAVRALQGEQQSTAGKYKDAAASYRAAYDLYRGDTTYRGLAVDAYRRWGDDAAAHYQYDDAIKAFDKAFQLDTSDLTSKTKLAGAYNTRGLFNLALGDLGKAREDFRAALGYFPDNTEYQSNLTAVGG